MTRKTVTYWKAGARKPKPAVITGIAADSGLRLRVGHSGEIYGNAAVGVPLKTSRLQTNVYSPVRNAST